MLCRPVPLGLPRLKPGAGLDQIAAAVPGGATPEVERLAQAWGTDEVLWRAEGEIAAVANESLRSAGASLALTERVMARALPGTDVDAWLAGGNPSGVSTNLVADEETFEALVEVETTGWGWPPRSADVLVDDWVSLRADLESSSKFALLATVNGTPASVARLALSESVVRLGGAVDASRVPSRGLYRSLWRPAASSRQADGATLALTKGRVETSAPNP